MNSLYCRRALPLLLLVLALLGFTQLASSQEAKPAASPSATPPSATPPPASPTGPHAAQGIPSGWQNVPIPPLHVFDPQDPRRVELPNGMVIFLQTDHELPLINGVIQTRGGARDEPVAKAGLNELYGEVWRTGGTKNKTGDQLDDFLESRAALVETSGGQESSLLSWSSLKGDFDQVFPVILDLLENPEFRQDKIDLAKKEMESLISRRNDDMDEISRRESNKLAYGPDNPYARSPEYYTLETITREDLLRWHQRTVAPNNMIVGISGDFDSETMERKLREAFAGMPRGERFVSARVEFHRPRPGVYLVDKNDVNQSEITMVDLGTDRHNPDYYALEVMNELFGGGFGSRLFSVIRTKLGLAYAVGGGVGTGFDHPGTVHLFVGTKSRSTAKAIAAMNHEIVRMAHGGVTPRELKKAKDGILNSFIFEFDSKDKVMAERMRYEFYGYPQDWLERYRTGIEKVTPADVDRVAKKYLQLDKMAILVVGNAKDFDSNLAAFGTVTPVDISIPVKKTETANTN